MLDIRPVKKHISIIERLSRVPGPQSPSITGVRPGKAQSHLRQRLRRPSNPASCPRHKSPHPTSPSNNLSAIAKQSVTCHCRVPSQQKALTVIAVQTATSHRHATPQPLQNRASHVIAMQSPSQASPQKNSHSHCCAKPHRSLPQNAIPLPLSSPPPSLPGLTR